MGWEGKMKIEGKNPGKWYRVQILRKMRSEIEGHGVRLTLRKIGNFVGKKCHFCQLKKKKCQVFDKFLTF